MASTEMTLDMARRCWLSAQQLNGGAGGGTAAIVRSGGWMYSAGGGGPYVALRARIPLLRREEVDRAIFDRRELVEVISVRSATMLVAPEDQGLALQAGRRAYQQRVGKLHERCAITATELDRLSARIVGRLEESPATTEQLRLSVPSELVRDLGAQGKKAGEPSTLSLALKQLQLEGLVERVSLDKRLDSNRFIFRNAGARERHAELPEEELDRQLADRFIRWAGPATVAETAFWIGIGVRKARSLLESSPLARVTIAETGHQCFVSPESLESVEGVRNHGSSVAFLPFRDNYLSFRRPPSALTDGDGESIEVLDWTNRPTTLAASDSLHQSAILVNGSLAGIWEFDGEAQELVFRLFARGHEEAVRHAAGEMESFIANDLGDFRYYAFDGARTRGARLQFVRG